MEFAGRRRKAKGVAHSTSKKTGRDATQDAIEDATFNVSIQGSMSSFTILLDECNNFISSKCDG